MEVQELLSRCIIIRVNPEQLLTIMGGWRKARIIELPVFKNIPTDAVFRSAHFDYTTNSFHLLVCHESFETVPEGHAFYVYDPDIEMVNIEQQADCIAAGAQE